MPSRILKEFLDSQGVRYVIITHSPAYTAQQIAQSAHIPGKELAKTVITIIDGKMAMAVLPASYAVDFDYFRKEIGAKKIELATEEQFKDKFPDCEIGFMPPFGNLYGMEVYVDQHLTKDQEIAFNAGNHMELFRLSYQDFERLVKPKVVKFT
ncbi:MAG TPA: YbaK/EbsC family protein [Smithella sp.]|nr:YbaK/EbsC family protein [Smithella sp.]MDM7987609.1 YbaK/EbsC family protein [Smithella sp.]HNY51377.1 YbaK/EbsC family protein [Smithella sp.]HOG91474.1 YbaK/EbsC family protein [Smithella sp.]HOU50389.1 YbaK/EbsC family protein [Smithella sp.]